MEYAVFPDIHGRYDLLSDALDYVYHKTDIKKIIFLGDYIDRGKDTVEVLDVVMNPPEGYEFICLKGNHEDMLIENHVYDPQAVAHLHKSTMGIEYYLKWMKGLKHFHFEGNNVFAHAYYDTEKDPEDQEKQMVLWARMSDSEDWQASSRDKTMYLTHGHTPRKDGPILSTMRCNLDAGAVFYDRLVIAIFEDGVDGPIRFEEFGKTGD